MYNVPTPLSAKLPSFFTNILQRLSKTLFSSTTGVNSTLGGSLSSSSFCSQVVSVFCCIFAPKLNGAGPVLPATVVLWVKNGDPAGFSAENGLAADFSAVNGDFIVPNGDDLSGGFSDESFAGGFIPKVKPAVLAEVAGEVEVLIPKENGCAGFSSEEGSLDANKLFEPGDDEENNDEVGFGVDVSSLEYVPVLFTGVVV